MTNKKHYNILCTYATECTCIRPVDAYSEEEAKAIAAQQFKEWNADWVNKEHGNPKHLIGVKVIG